MTKILAAQVGLLAGLFTISTADAQDGLLIALTDGSHVQGAILGLAELDGGKTLRVLVEGDASERSIDMRSIIGIHGRPPNPSGRVEVYLVGGDRILGRFRGGDREGESFFLQSVTLGSRAIPIDRLSVMLFRDRAGNRGPEDFMIPESVQEEEALFFPARVRGFDRRFGAIHRFTAKAIQFEESGADPRDFAIGELSAITLRGGLMPAQSSATRLLTHGGDLIGVDLIGVEDGKLRFLLEDGAVVALPASQISALSFSSPRWVFLSDLPLLEAKESSYFDQAGYALRPHRVDRSAMGEFLEVGGRTYIKGLGVHSRSILSWRVPAGATMFQARVGLDDSVLELPVRGEVSLAVRLDGKVLYVNESLAGGAGPIDLGQLPVSPGAVLSLEVDFGKGYDLGDRVDWLDAMFLIEI